MIARSDRVAEDPQLFRDFMSALARGTAAAVRDPEAAVEVIADSNEANPEIGRKETEAEVEATFPFFPERLHEP